MAGNVQMVKGRTVAMDFLQLGANAFASGLVVAITLAVITLALATSAQAAPIESVAMRTACRADASEEPRSVASTPADEDAAGVGALWANLLLATVGLSNAGIVTLLGRAVPAGGAEDDQRI